MDTHQANIQKPIARQGLKSLYRLSLPKGTAGVTHLSFHANEKAAALRAPKLYYGVGTAGQNTQAFILALAGKKAIENANSFFEAAPSALQKAYFAIPQAYGPAAAYINSQPGWFNAPTAVSVTDAETGYIENYSLYESTSLNLGSIKVYLEEA